MPKPQYITSTKSLQVEIKHVFSGLPLFNMRWGGGGGGEERKKERKKVLGKNASVLNKIQTQKVQKNAYLLGPKFVLINVSLCPNR